MAATDDRDGRRAAGGSTVLLAALALPGLMPAPAQAEEPPAQSLAAFKYLYYQDGQPGFDRIEVQAPSLRVLVPFATHFSMDAGAVVDSVSGASPRYYSTVSGASRMEDTRYAEDVRLTWYRPRSAFGVAYTHSDENDYVSNAVALDARFSSADQNRTFNIGIGGSHDRIDPVNNIVDGETRDTRQVIAGVTQALSSLDLVQLQIGRSSGDGYYSDPYKLFDNRPRERDQTTVLLRWNHHFEGPGATLRSGYRYYDDSYEVRAHSFQFEWVQPLKSGVSISPALRYHTQTAAWFYVDPAVDDNGESQPPLIPDGRLSSLDQRLAAWGGVSGALKLAWAFAPNWSTDFRVEYYEQRSEWRPDGDGSPGIGPFEATWFEFGMARGF